MKLIIDIPEKIYKASQIVGDKFNDVIQIPLEVIAESTVLEPCEDAISREDALEALNTINGTAELDKAFEVIENLPFVTPSRPTEHKPICDDCIYFADGKGSEKCDSCELTGTNKPSRRKGHWITTDYIKFTCSECGWEGNCDTKFCSNCGAEMESE